MLAWDRVPDDPIFRLTFPQAGMLSPQDFQRMDRLLEQHASPQALRQAANEMRSHLNPHPAGQMTHNVPELEGETMEGMQHKYSETVLFFPARGQTCHAYCTYCFRWAQFVGVPEIKFEAKESAVLADYLRAHPHVTDLLVTGGDPMIMKTEILRKYLEPVLSPDLAHVQTIRIGTKSLAYWPMRYLRERVFMLDFLQARNAQWVGQPFFARFDPEATWLTELKPWGADRFFFEDECATSAALAR